MIPVFKPLIEKEEINASIDALEMGWLGMGSFVNEFENHLKEFLNANNRYVSAVSTGHAALHIALIIAGVENGDEVITPSFNNIADVQAIKAVGAKPVFCDINYETLSIDLDKAESLITKRTKAIIATDYGCHLCDHDALKIIASKFKLRVIHDSAHSFGSSYKGKKIGSFSDISMFSFDPVKTITSIDGGALVVKTEEELRNIHEIRLIGMGQKSSLMYQNQRAWTYDVKQLGFRYHMANLHAAIGIQQLKKIDAIILSRQETSRYYSTELGGIEEIKIPKTDLNEITPFLYYILVPSEERQRLRKYLLDYGVDTGIHWQPAHWFELFKYEKKGILEITEKVGKEIITIPLHSKMPDKDAEKVVSLIKNYFS